MSRLLVVAISCIGLILFVSFIATRLIRSRSRGLSVRMQVFLALALIVGAFAFGLGLLVIDRVEARAARLANAAAADESRAIAAILQSEMARTGASFETLATQLDTWQPDDSYTATGSVGLELLATDGRPLYPEGRPSRAREPGAVFVDAPVTSDGRRLGTVRVVKPTIVIQALLADFAPTVLAISLVLGAAAAVAAAWIGRTIAAPIEALSAYSERVSAGERVELPTRVAGREVARLVQSIDTMRRRLEGRPFVETFAADLSHELKNPVAAIRASAEVLEDGALDEPEQARKFVRRVGEAASRIERLLAELLSLARIETRGAEGLERIELESIVAAVVREFDPRGERISLTIGGNPSLRADPLWLGRAIENLIHNALTHSNPNSTTSVQIAKKGEELVLRVVNPGRVAPHVRDSLFGRFVTTRQDKGGTGLGLPIVRAVAEAHGGRVELVRPGPPEVCFELSLPLAK